MVKQQMNRRAFLTGAAAAAGAGALVAGPFGVVAASAGEGTDHYVTNRTELEKAINCARPGSTIVMRDGTWTDLEIVIGGSARHGTPGAPIVLRAETGGQVVLNGMSRLAIGRDHWVVDGLLFTDGYSTHLRRPIEFWADENHPAHHSEIRNIAIKDFNPPDLSTRYEWVMLHGHHNRVTRCYFSGKAHLRDLLAGEALDGVPTRHRIDHNYFGEIPRPDPPGNGHGAVTPVYGTHYLQPDHFVVEHNLFRSCSGEAEIISVKSSHNIIRHNTFVDSQGYISLRHGNASEVYGNYFFFGTDGFGGGVRVTGADQRIYNNYFDGLWRGIIIHNSSERGAYLPVENAEILHNTFANVGHRVLTVGGHAGDNDAPPQSYLVANNIMWTTSGEMIEYRRDPVDPSYEGNIAYGAPLGIPNPGGISEVDPEMETDGGNRPVYLPAWSSPAVDGAVGSYPYVDEDIGGRDRPFGPGTDVGAHERSKGRVVYPPLTGVDVGPDYMTIS